MPREFRMAAMLRKSTICQALLNYDRILDDVLQIKRPSPVSPPIPLLFRGILFLVGKGDERRTCGY